MSKDEILRLISNELNRYGYEYRVLNSHTTNSLYYKVFNQGVSVYFRVSDHKPKLPIITFRTDYNYNRQELISFVRNRIENLRYRKVKDFLGFNPR